MGARIQEVRGTDEEQEEIAAFLAGFVQRGGLERPRPGDRDESVWARRLRWWWNENPMCGEDDPRGFMLRAEDETVVGFSGFIPVDYAVDGEIVPTLIATTFFVEESHRDSVMGVLMKIRALGRTHQIIDGSPSEKMRELLDRIGFSRRPERFQYFFPLRRLGGGLSRALLQRFGWSFPVDRAPAEGAYIATSPDEVETIPELRDGKLRRRLTIESLSWSTSVGSEPRDFFGLCDAEGTLRAYAIGIYKEKTGLTACLLMDFADLSGDGSAWPELLYRLIQAPDESGLAPGTSLLAWSVLEDEDRPSASGLRRDSILHFSLPSSLTDCPRASVPFESDLPLL